LERIFSRLWQAFLFFRKPSSSDGLFPSGLTIDPFFLRNFFSLIFGDPSEGNLRAMGGRCKGDMRPPPPSTPWMRGPLSFRGDLFRDTSRGFCWIESFFPGVGMHGFWRKTSFLRKPFHGGFPSPSPPLGSFFRTTCLEMTVKFSPLPPKKVFSPSKSLLFLEEVLPVSPDVSKNPFFFEDFF